MGCAELLLVHGDSEIRRGVGYPSPSLGAKTFPRGGSGAASEGCQAHCFWLYPWTPALPSDPPFRFPMTLCRLAAEPLKLCAPPGRRELQCLLHLELAYSFFQPGSCLLRTKLFKCRVSSTDLAGWVHAPHASTLAAGPDLFPPWQCDAVVGQRDSGHPSVLLRARGRGLRNSRGQSKGSSSHCFDLVFSLRPLH